MAEALSQHIGTIGLVQVSTDRGFGPRKLGLAGGGALNGTANCKLQQGGAFERAKVQPAADNAGARGRDADAAQRPGPVDRTRAQHRLRTMAEAVLNLRGELIANRPDIALQSGMSSRAVGKVCLSKRKQVPASARDRPPAFATFC